MRVSLKEIYIDGYKNITDSRIPLNDFNVLVGPNNSGKSNFFEIFAFVRALVKGSESFRRRIFKIASTPRGFSICRVKKDKPINISFKFELNTRPKRIVEYSCSLSCKLPGKMKDGSNYTGFNRESLTIKEAGKTGKAISLIDRTKTQFKCKGVKKKHTHKINKYLSSIQAVLTHYPELEGLHSDIEFALVALMHILNSQAVSLEPEEMRDSFNRDKDYLFDLDYRISSFDLISVLKRIHRDVKLFKEYKDIVSQILGFDDIVFDEITQKLPREKNVKEHTEVLYYLVVKFAGAYSSFKDFSDGSFVVAGMLALLFSNERDSALFCIEEPENYLHPKAIKVLINYLLSKSKENQMIISTHSSYMLNHISPEDVIIAKMKSDGMTKFEKVENVKELKRRLRQGYISFGDLLETEFKEDEGIEV